MTLVPDGLLAWADRTPERPALVVGARSRRYGELAASVRQVAGWIAGGAAGEGKAAGSGPRVGLLLGNGVEFVETFLGTAMAGAAAMVLDPRWSDEQLRRVLEEVPPDLLFAEPALIRRLSAVADRMQVVVVGEADGPSAWASAGRPAATAWRAGRPPDRDPVRGVAADAPFYIGFTSGTTGLPKAFTRTHRSWVASFAASAAEFGTGPADRILVLGSLVHSMPLFHTLEGLHAGATVHLLDHFDAGTVLAALAEHAVTLLVAVPTLLKAVADTAARRPADSGGFPGLRAVISSGAKLEPGLRARLAALFPAAETIEYYGATELSFVSVARSGEAVPPDSVGRPFHGVTVAIRRADGTEAAPGEAGLVWVRSGMVSLGYLRPRGDGTGFRTEAGWATVGDWGWRDEAGYLHLAGREQDMMITGGLNVYPAEVEAALLALPEIAEAVVFAVPDPDWGDLVCAVLRWQGDARLSRAVIAERLRAGLDRRKVPRRVFVVEAFPVTGSAKIARARLRDRAMGAAGPPLEEVP